MMQHASTDTIVALRMAAASVLLCLTVAVRGVDVSRLPAMLLVTIETDGHVNPPRTLAYAPEGMWGLGITGNNYVTGRMTMTLGDSVIYDSGPYVENVSGMRVRIRGNTSGVTIYPPYKVKLTKKADLMGGGVKDKEWLLVKIRKDGDGVHPLLNYPLCRAIGRLVGMEWQPRYRYANLVFNGDYKGVYLITDPVAKGKGRCELPDTGYLIENDPYWWNEDGVFFRTDRQDVHMGYTFKYPKREAVTDSVVALIRDRLNGLEDALWEDGDVTRYIDMRSWAAWMLAHDVMGTGDYAGSNMFMYKEDASDESPIKMGPLWDADTMFRLEGWSGHHISNVFYYKQLFRREDFRRAYAALWFEVEPRLEGCVEGVIADVMEECGDALRESWELNNERWSMPLPSLDENIEHARRWYAGRRAWMEEQLKEYRDLLPVAAPDACPDIVATRVYDISGVLRDDCHTLPPGLYIVERIYADGTHDVRRIRF